MQRPSSHQRKLSCDVTHESQPRRGPSFVSFFVICSVAHRLKATWSFASFCLSADLQCLSRQCQDRAAAPRGPSLFAFPLESNYSGARYAPAMVNQIQKEGLVVASQKAAKEQNFARNQPQESQAPGQLQPGIQPESIGNHQREEFGEAVEVQQAAQGWTKEEEHQQHQPATEKEAADGLSGQQGDEDEAGGLSSRSSHSEGARWHVLIDAAKACATAPPDLTKHPADFVVHLLLPLIAFSNTVNRTCSMFRVLASVSDHITEDLKTENSSFSGSCNNFEHTLCLSDLLCSDPAAKMLFTKWYCAASAAYHALENIVRRREITFWTLHQRCLQCSHQLLLPRKSLLKIPAASFADQDLTYQYI